jgi:hypothetical protein
LAHFLEEVPEVSDDREVSRHGMLALREVVDCDDRHGERKEAEDYQRERHERDPSAAVIDRLSLSDGRRAGLAGIRIRSILKPVPSRIRWRHPKNPTSPVATNPATSTKLSAAITDITVPSLETDPDGLPHARATSVPSCLRMIRGKDITAARRMPTE